MSACSLQEPPECPKCGAPMEFEGIAQPQRDQPGFSIYSCFECDELLWLKTVLVPPCETM